MVASLTSLLLGHGLKPLHPGNPGVPAVSIERAEVQDLATYNLTVETSLDTCFKITLFI